LATLRFKPKWFKPGQRCQRCGLILNEPVAAMSIRNPTKPTYLFESSELMAFGINLLERLLPEDLKYLASMTRTDDFPYRIGGKLACRQFLSSILMSSR
jgi:hypothetical protein